MRNSTRLGRIRERADIDRSWHPNPAVTPAQSPCGVVHGELVAGQGRTGDFYRLAPHMMAKRRKTTLTFVAFDVMHLAGRSTLDLIYTQRPRRALSRFGPAPGTGQRPETLDHDLDRFTEGGARFTVAD